MKQFFYTLTILSLFTLACGEIPQNQSTISSSDSARVLQACTQDSECLSGSCDNGYCEASSLMNPLDVNSRVLQACSTNQECPSLYCDMGYCAE